MKLRSTVACLSFIAVCFTSGYGEVYRAHPSSPLKLEGGFDPLRPTSLLAPCLDSDGVDPKAASGGAATKYSSVIVTTQDDLYKSLNVDATLSARYTFFSASAKMSFS